mmetsp:Transcript_104575/g.145747  ORF Transcript_104575/g.145747 Transcript_104575/m.145747 type:complete len:93 (+) Transcript_104575:415-693(+)
MSVFTLRSKRFGLSYGTVGPSAAGFSAGTIGSNEGEPMSLHPLHQTDLKEGYLSSDMTTMRPSYFHNLELSSYKKGDWKINDNGRSPFPSNE